MNFVQIFPSPKLAPYVRFFWILEGNASQDNPYIHHAMADGCVELIFHYKGMFDELLMENVKKKSVTSGLIGPSKNFKRFVINRSFGILGAYLYPFAIQQLFSVPVTDLKNQVVDLNQIIGNESNDLENKIMSEKDYEGKISIVSTFLENRLIKSDKQYLGVFETIRFIIQTNGRISVEELAKRNFLSERQFERSFKMHSGFTPKLFSRIIRFQSALNYYSVPEKSLTAVAYDCGYYDQSHFIQDFKEFSGLHPGDYFSDLTDATDWRNV